MPTYKEMQKIVKQINSERKEREDRRYQVRLSEMNKMGLKPFDKSQCPKKRCDHPNTMEDSTATVLWIVLMIVSMLFKGGWALCVFETIVWLKFITRYN